jgi:hypothetical protein
MLKPEGHQRFKNSYQRVTWNKHWLYTSALSTSCFVLSVMDGKIEQRFGIEFCMKLGKFATETLEMLCEAFGECSLTGQRFLDGIPVSRRVEYQSKMMNF